MWVVAQYMPVAPISLKPAAATSSGGKTLLALTPYAIKMALLDVAIRTLGLPEGERLFPALRDLSISLELPRNLVVIKGFSRSWRPVESKDSKKENESVEDFEARRREKLAERIEKQHYPFYPTIAYREYLYYQQPFRMALTTLDNAPLPTELPQLLTSINYFGKRGGFVQVMALPTVVEQLPQGNFVSLTPGQASTFYRNGTLQMLDDCGPTLTFQRANIYSPDRIALGKERLLRHVVLPYRLKQSSRSYSWYESITEQE